jgi:hypothetical protein
MRYRNAAAECSEKLQPERFLTMFGYYAFDFGKGKH